MWTFSNECKRRKSKCNGQHPCEHCVYHSLHCHYPQSPIRGTSASTSSDPTRYVHPYPTDSLFSRFSLTGTHFASQACRRSSNPSETRLPHCKETSTNCANKKPHRMLQLLVQITERLGHSNRVPRIRQSPGSQRKTVPVASPTRLTDTPARRPLYLLKAPPVTKPANHR